MEFQREPSEISDNFNDELIEGWDKMLADPIYETQGHFMPAPIDNKQDPAGKKTGSK